MPVGPLRKYGESKPLVGIAHFRWETGLKMLTMVLYYSGMGFAHYSEQPVPFHFS
jgi:hypothetical protein